MSAYTDEDVDAIHGILIELQGAYRRGTPEAILDAVAPVVAARALREAADSVEGQGSFTHVRRWLRERADEIEGKR